MDLPVRKTSAAPTLAQAVAERLRRDIVRCVFLPGQSLRLDDLKQCYGVGYSPLREALMALAGEHLVMQRGQKGFRVAPVSRRDLDEVMDARIRLDALALEDALVNASTEWEAGILAAFHLLSREPRFNREDGTVSDIWSERHKAFHLALVNSGANRLIIKFWETAYDRAERYRQLAISKSSSGRDDGEEHRQLMKAALERNGPSLLDLSKRHIQKTHEIIVFDVASRIPLTD